MSPTCHSRIFAEYAQYRFEPAFPPKLNYSETIHYYKSNVLIKCRIRTILKANVYVFVCAIVYLESGVTSVATIKDVARVAGVSTTTVSHVLNQTRFVSPETTERVVKAVEELNFDLNAVARNLRASKTNIIGIVIPDLYGSFFSSLIRSAERELEELGYNFFLFHTDRNPKREAEFIRKLVGYKVDGLIVAVTDPEENLSLFQWVEEQDLPIVFVDRMPPKGIHGSAVTTNNYEMTKLAVKHLFESYEEVVLITPMPDASPLLERQSAYRDVCEERGCAPIVAMTSGWGADVGYGQMQRILLERKKRPFGVFCVTIEVSRGAFRKLKEENVQIPLEVGIAGFDDASWTTLVTPEITVVRSNPVKIGQIAVKRLLEKIHDDRVNPIHELIPADLIIRGSSMIQKGI